ncbi:hypothetical protein OS493_001058 [Desmophyllum pertusum]|uniref:CENP-V/GFA domain-containing protein n=1 Tax=Desmophyllum pertusum TaxID=174260 RepID=A0A9X0D5Y0_9CNID|nr:hypothetical protein OS493_001058 [Desmophyllum pertusum]
MSVNLVKHTGGCHCGKVRFEVLAKPEIKAYDCNINSCTICAKKGLFAFYVPKENFKLLQGEDNISCYTYNTHQAKHYFLCDINPNGYGISVRCLDEGTVQKTHIVYADCNNWDNWQRYLEEHPKAATHTENVE